MPIDPSIALQVRPLQVENPLNQLAQFYNVKGAQQGIQANALKMQQAQAEMANQNALRQYLSTADPNNPATSNELLKFGPAGAQIAKTLDERRKAELDTAAQKLTLLGQLLGGVKDEASWQAVRPKIAQLGDASDVPANFDPNWVQQHQEQSLSYLQRIQQLKPMSVSPGGVIWDPTTRQPLFQNPSVQAQQVVTPTMSEVVDPADQSRMLRIDAKTYRGGTLGDPGVLGVSGKMPVTTGAGGLSPKTVQMREAKYPAATSALKSATAANDDLIAELEKLKNDPGVNQITGLVYGVTPNVTREARRAQAVYDRILAKGGFSELQKMRDASPTGGALGQVSDSENKYLRAAFAALDKKQNTEDFKAALDEVIGRLRESNQRLRGAYELDYEYRGTSGAPQAQEAPPTAKQAPPDYRWTEIPFGAIQMLRSQPNLRDAFDEKYGKGAAASILEE